MRTFIIAIVFFFTKSLLFAQCNITVVSAVTGNKGEKLRIYFDGNKLIQSNDNGSKAEKCYIVGDDVYISKSHYDVGDMPWIRVDGNEANSSRFDYQIKNNNFYIRNNDVGDEEGELGDWEKIGYVSNGKYYKFTGSRQSRVETLHFIDEKLCAESNKALKFALIHLLLEL